MAIRPKKQQNYDKKPLQQTHTVLLGGRITLKSIRPSVQTHGTTKKGKKTNGKKPKTKNFNL